MAVDDGNGGVRYSQREMFDRIDGKLDALAEKLDAKADAIALQNLERRVATLELWTAGANGSQQREAQITGRQLAWAALIVALVGAVATLVWLASSH